MYLHLLAYCIFASNPFSYGLHLSPPSLLKPHHCKTIDISCTIFYVSCSSFPPLNATMHCHTLCVFSPCYKYMSRSTNSTTILPAAAWNESHQNSISNPIQSLFLLLVLISSIFIRVRLRANSDKKARGWTFALAMCLFLYSPWN